MPRPDCPPSDMPGADGRFKGVRTLTRWELITEGVAMVNVDLAAQRLVSPQPLDDELE